MSFASINNAPFGLALQKGEINGFSGIQKFGYNSSVGTSFETIWTNGTGLYQYPTSATTAVATSSNTADDNGGTVHIFGLTGLMCPCFSRFHLNLSSLLALTINWVQAITFFTLV